ncbi:MAG: hypothetical protein ACRCTL_08775 [Pseudomonas sp.]
MDSRKPQANLLAKLLLQAAPGKVIRQRFLQRLAQQATLPGLDYHFDQPLAGDSWYPREHQAGTYWRFTGPASTASLYFPKVAAPQGFLALTIYHAVSPAHAEMLQASCNGIPLERCPTTSHRLLFKLLPAALAAQPYICIELTTPPTVQPGGDSRWLGIAVQRVEIY